MAEADTAYTFFQSEEPSLTTKWFFFPAFHHKMHLMQEDAHDTQVKNDFACTITVNKRSSAPFDDDLEFYETATVRKKKNRTASALLRHWTGG
ncbi:hypothetical protein [Geobacillus thermoleovorans]|uniref:hypothetical protein n=1 Tax=Geobacillus thermoleovorans TaxID=33941 RepID=UPI003DA635EF